MVSSSTASSAVRDQAFAALRAGLCPIPPAQDGSKAPIGKGEPWKQYQTVRPNEEQIDEWYSNDRTGLGLVCGAISGGLEALDIDDIECYRALRELAKAVGLEPLLESIEQGCSETSPNGARIYWRCSEVKGNTKLARRPKLPEEMENPDDKIKVLLETRGEGGFIITAPSYGTVHPSGKPYKALHGGFETIVTITPEERESLLDLARNFDQMPKSEVKVPDSPTPTKNGLRPGDDYNLRAEWPSILESAGWRSVYEGKDVTFWRRPGKTEGISATTNYAGTDLLYVFSSSTPFEPDRTYTKFATFALLNHDNDYTAAAKALSLNGYGDKPTRKEATGYSHDPGEYEVDNTPILTIIGLDSVVREEVTPLWPKRIFRGKLTIVAGDPGLGKSYMSLDIAARVSLGGPWPDDSGNAPLGNVLLVSAEDGIADTIKPRLELLGADMSRIFSLDITVKKGEEEVGLSLKEHTPQIEQKVRELDISLLVIDPVLAFTGRVDTHKSAEVRALLAPLAAMAERTGCALLGIMHPNKNSTEGNLMYRISSSLDFAAAARSVMVMGKHPDNPELRVMATVKCNLSAIPEPMAFGFTHDGCFTWHGTADIDVSQIMASPIRDEDRNELEEAVRFLEGLLEEGPIPAKTVETEAKNAAISMRTVQRAKKKLGIESARDNSAGGSRGKGEWKWYKPEDVQHCQTPSPTVGNLERSRSNGHSPDTEDQALFNIANGNLEDAQIVADTGPAQAQSFNIANAETQDLATLNDADNSAPDILEF